MKRGEVNVYGEVRRKRKRDADEEDPNELAMPTNGSDPASSSRKNKNKAKKRKGRLGTGESSGSDEDDDDDDIGDGTFDEEVNEELNAEDAWLETVSKKGESGIYHSSNSTKQKSRTTASPTYLKDTPTALQELLQLFQEGPTGETVLRLIKRLTPSDVTRNKKAKIQSSEAPSTSTQDHLDQEAASKLKAKFDKCVAIADFLLDSGFTTIYDATYETVSNRLNPKTSKKQQNEAERKEIVQGEEGAFWQYKWTIDATEIYGPFDTESMKAWVPSFSSFTGMVVRGAESPSVASKLSPSEDWMPFEPLLWS
jgi:hypothetical protein